MSKKILWLLVVLVATGFIGLAATGYADVHPDVTVKDFAGNAVQGGSSTPYSPKQTCGGCHNYESDPVDVTKQQTVGGTANPSYQVKVASHGVTAGYHFQQGMNVPWGQTQRDFYGLPSFTSSPGMVGKY